MTLTRCIMYGIFAAALFCGEGAAAVRIPLMVKEALASGTPGTDRIAEPVTIGVPLAENSGIRSTSQLGLEGAKKAQFKALGAWPNGNVRWVVIDTLASLNAGQTNHSLVLRDGGSGNFGGASLAVEDPDYITVDTGSATFRIRRRNFNFFDQVTVGGSVLVMPGNPGCLRVRDADNKTYASSNDDASTATVEENGPVKAVVKAVGRFKDRSGHAFMGYTVRFYFYSGKSYVKTIVTLRNTFLDSPSSKLFNSFEAVVPATLGAEKSVDFSTAAGPVAVPFTQSAHLYQSYANSKPKAGYMDCTHWNPPFPGTCKSPSGRYDPVESGRGLEIRSDKEIIHPLGDPDQWSPGWMELRDKARLGVTAVYRWMGSYWPAGFEVTSDGVITAGLYSSLHTVHTGANTAAAGLKFPFFAQDQRELFWHFHAQPLDNRAFNTIAHHPLIGKADWGQYVSTKCLWGQGEYLAADQQTRFFSAFGKKLDVLSSTPPFKINYRNYSWGAGGGGNQGDYAFFGAMFEWLRTGIAEYYLRAENLIHFQINAGVLRTDWDYAAVDVVPVDKYRDIKPCVRIALANPPSTPEIAHRHIYSLPMFYYLTGYEEAKDAFMDDAEVNIRNNIRNIWPCGRTDKYFDGEYIRAWSRKIRNMALQWEFSIQMGKENKVLKSYVLNATAGLIDSVVHEPKPGSKGRSRTRGYYVGDSTNTRAIHSFFYTQIMFEALYQVHRILVTHDPTQVRIADLDECMGGMAQFFFKDYFYENAKGGRYWDYNFFLDRPWSPEGRQMVRYPADRAALFGYIYDGGDEDYLKKGYDALVAYQVYDLGKSYPYWTEAQAQALMYAHQVTPPDRVWSHVKPSVQDHGNHRYTLTWTTPPGAEKYRIKFSNKPIVDRLGFNKTDQSWQYHPDHYTPRYYATLYGGEVLPRAAGSTHSITIDISKAVSEYNSKRGRKKGEIGYVDYYPSAPYYFDIRCYAPATR